MAIGVTAKLVVKEGHAEQFETLFNELQNSVNENEAGCIFYAIHKSRTDSLEYMVLEQYRDQQALDAHQQAEYFKRIGVQLAEHVATAPEVTFFDSV